MTDEERREMMRNNYAAQMEMLGYQPDGNPKDLVEIVRCKDCKNWVGNGADIDELPYWLPCKGEMRQPNYYCADGKRR